MSIVDILLNRNVINEDTASAVMQDVSANGVDIETALKQKGVPEEEILTAKSDYLQIPKKSLDGVDVSFEILKNVPEESAKHYRFAPIGITDGILEIGIVDPENIDARDALNFISTKINLPYKLFLISESDFENLLKSYKGLSGEVTKALSELEEDLSDEEIEINRQKTEDVASKINQTNIIEDAPVTKIVATILRYAIEGGASDVHVEPMREKTQVRFRVDGILHTSILLPIKIHSAVAARIKILSNMKLDEKRKPQDGRFSARIDGRKIDFRVSTFPTYFGEKIVMRILDQEKGVKSLDTLGILPRPLEMLREALNRPYGLILISGPTGSGKTTTLYSMLNEINRAELNVLSLEDPVEYNIEGVSQSQVHSEIGYTFASGLRTTLRQDPDVILVGEIRDKETAQLAIQAALTGHLVLSTIHTNSGVGIVPRLVDMGIDPYLIAPTLILGMAQRLVGKIPPTGGIPMKVEDSLKIMIEKQFADLPEEFKKDIPWSDEVLGIKPTPEYPKGILGRQAVFEVYKMDKDLERVILSNPTEPEIIKIVRARGMITMKEDAIIKAFQKIVPIEEANKL